MTCSAQSWKCLLFGTLLTMLLSPAHAQPESAVECDSFECFQLYTACQPIDLVVEDLHPAAEDIGLQKQAIINAAESRLRSARIYDPSSRDFLYVNINVVGNAFSISLEFKKEVFDFRTARTQGATTWDTGTTGTHGRTGSSYILGALSELLDIFLIEFLRVNEQACNGAQ